MIEILINYLERSSNVGTVFLGLCLSVLTITIIRQTKKKKLVIKKNSKEKTLDDYSLRDLFHFFINEEYHADKFHLAKEFSERMHLEASQYMMVDHEDDPDFPEHFTYIPYNKEKINQKLDYIYQRLLKERYLDWCDAGQPVSSNSRYWWAQTKVHLINYLIQREPYHLTDGVWLRGIPQGPMSSIQSKLFSIYIDELGNGDPNQNHPNVYLDVLKSLGLHIPPITSREFVDQQSILDISFKQPLLTLTTSLFPKTFQPEILGYTLWLETTSPTEHIALRKIFERYNINPKFSLLHTAIDNSINGHGRYARQAVEEYLDHIKETEGKEALEEHWKRVWIGYVAYGTTGKIDNDLKKLFEKQKKLTPRDEFIQVIKRKAPIAQKMHGTRRIGPGQNLLNEMFASGDAEKLCHELANSDMIVKGEPGKSKLLNHAVSFRGPMYQIFNADELSIITRWICSLEPSTVNNVISLIMQRRKLAQHIQSDVKLKLLDGSDKLLRDLFEENPVDILTAFRVNKWNIPQNGENLTKENVRTCPLMESIYENGILEDVFDHNGEDEEILQKWLLEGSPLPDETLQSSQNEQNHVNIRSHLAFNFKF